MALINQVVLMSGADYFSDEYAINAHMNASVPINVSKATEEHRSIKQALEQAGIKVIKIPPPENCQDGVYTANWGLCRGDKVVLSSLPNKRKTEEPYAEKILKDLGKKVIKPPGRFSGQGDALPCGEYLFVGSLYRTDQEVHKFLADNLGFEVIGLQTVPKRSWFGFGKPVTNKVTGWPDSFFYDLDLALAVLTPNLIAWCPDAFLPDSQAKIQALPLEKIEVSLQEAKAGFGCNLISSGETVVMSARAPKLKAAIEAKGLKTITPEVAELGKGGGYIRCTTLTLS
ncbi:MAG TPA: arginine deiminase-related protein [Patescibacteria group bacterium]|nr:arginine deiminase-related protein [Patescibacteria group bacterium]